MNIQKKYIKKVIVNHPLSSPEARAERLRRVRNMANLTREEMCNSQGLNINTYKGWEIARYGGLPIDGAEKTIARAAEEDVICNLEWLLHGIGISPYIVPEYRQTISMQQNAKLNVDQEKQNMLNEIQLFKKQHLGGASYQIEDDGLTDYGIGDLVAGLPCYQQRISLAAEKDCIVQTATGLVIARRLRLGETPGKYNLVCTNPQTSAKKPVFYDMDLISAAPIIRHYRRNSSW